MAFLDPQSVKIGTATISLPRVSSGPSSGGFQSNDGSTVLRISHSQGRRDQHRIRLDVTKVAPDPFQTAVNASYSMGVQVIVDVPKVGYTIADQKSVVDALVAYLSANTGAAVTQLLGDEN